jgi:hypothetical protein
MGPDAVGFIYQQKRQTVRLAYPLEKYENEFYLVRCLVFVACQESDNERVVHPQN